MTRAERFWAKVDCNGPIPRPDLGPCWLWVAYIDKKGYGIFRWASYQNEKAHRASYRLVIGPIPSDRELDHLCKTRNCVRPTHLEPVTHAVNVARGDYSVNGLRMLTKSRCPQGHPYDLGNTGYKRNGWRFCRQCKSIQNAASYRRRVARAA